MIHLNLTPCITPLTAQPSAGCLWHSWGANLFAPFVSSNPKKIGGETTWIHMGLELVFASWSLVHHCIGLWSAKLPERGIWIDRILQWTGSHKWYPIVCEMPSMVKWCCYHVVLDAGWEIDWVSCGGWRFLEMQERQTSCLLLPQSEYTISWVW